MSPFQGNAHQVTEKRNAAHIRRLRRGELCISAASGRSPIPPCSPSRLVALSRCPDAGISLPAAASGVNGTKVIRGLITERDGPEHRVASLTNYADLP